MNELLTFQCCGIQGWVGVASGPCVNFTIKLLDPELLNLKP